MPKVNLLVTAKRGLFIFLAPFAIMLYSPSLVNIFIILLQLKGIPEYAFLSGFFDFP